MIAAHAHAIGVDHVFLHEDREAGRPAAHVDAGRPQLLFIFHKARHAGDIGRAGEPASSRSQRLTQ
jgi:hypothetical protein